MFSRYEEHLLEQGRREAMYSEPEGVDAFVRAMRERIERVQRDLPPAATPEETPEETQARQEVERELQKAQRELSDEEHKKREESFRQAHTRETEQTKETMQRQEQEKIESMRVAQLLEQSRREVRENAPRSLIAHTLPCRMRRASGLLSNRLMQLRVSAWQSRCSE